MHTVVLLSSQERKQVKQRLPVYEAQVGALEPETESSQQRRRWPAERAAANRRRPRFPEGGAVRPRNRPLRLRKGKASASVLGGCPLGAASRRG